MKHPNARVNTIVASDVYAAQLLQRSHGTQSAARFLAKRGISIDIALRVLLCTPARRWRMGSTELLSEASVADCDTAIILQRRLASHVTSPQAENLYTERLVSLRQQTLRQASAHSSG